MGGTRKTEAMQPSAMRKEDFAALWKSIHLKVTDTYDVPPEILWVNGSTIGTLGNFSASTGKAKSKKTFNISAIVAAALTNDEVLHYSACLPPNKRKILYVDTEQSKYHCHKVMERILRLAGLPTDQDRDDFVFIVLREQTPDMRKRIIGYMLENMPDVGLLIIDGIRDLMYDINSPGESTDLINLLMRWARAATSSRWQGNSTAPTMCRTSWNGWGNRLRSSARSVSLFGSKGQSRASGSWKSATSPIRHCSVTCRGVALTSHWRKENAGNCASPTTASPTSPSAFRMWRATTRCATPSSRAVSRRRTSPTSGNKGNRGKNAWCSRGS